MIVADIILDNANPDRTNSWKITLKAERNVCKKYQHAKYNIT